MDGNTGQKRLKLLVIGDSTVGKTSLTLRFTKEEFVHSHIQTIGIDVQSKTLTITNELVELQIVLSTQWDTAGQERYRAIHSQYYRQANGVMLVFDTSNRDTFDHMEYWIQTLTGYTAGKLPVILVGNKCDLEERGVTREEGEEFAKKHGLPFLEASAKLNTNVDSAFCQIASLMLSAVHQDSPPPPNLSLRLKTADRYQPHKKACLCHRSVSKPKRTHKWPA